MHPRPHDAGESSAVSAVWSKVDGARSEPSTDGELVAATRRGEAGAFEQLYRRHAAYALALAVRVQGHSGDVEDILHDAFLRVHDQLDHLRSGDSFRAWLSSIVVRLVRTRMRRRRLLSALGLGTDELVDLDALVNADAGPELRAQLAQIYAILNEVPVDQRICWALRYLEGRKLEEVAHIAGCSLATAKRRIADVQRRLTGGVNQGRPGAGNANQGQLGAAGDVNQGQLGAVGEGGGADRDAANHSGAPADAGGWL
ncbi:MAG TPA: RNA polymerase sigma factor [Polyangiaceae bacterium]|nr:RNA polymerase sigma factor [Polyangiaceae bacterium]